MALQEQQIPAHMLLQQNGLKRGELAIKRPANSCHLVKWPWAEYASFYAITYNTLEILFCLTHVQ